MATLRPIGSARSAGKSVQFCGESISVEKLERRSFEKVDIAFFSAGGGVSREYVPIACKADAIAIDKSSAFRMDPHVPLVIPEINAQDMRLHRGIIANPNCTTTVMLMALYPLHRVFHVRRVFAATYQAVSGSGTRGVEELTRQTKEMAQNQNEPGSSTSAKATADRQPPATVFPHPIAFNLLPHVDSFLESGYTKEEAKMQDEARKIMHSPALRVSATCVRVPVYRAHSVAVTAEFQRPLSVEQAREILSKAPGLELVDEPNRQSLPHAAQRRWKRQLPGRPGAPGLRFGERPVVLGCGRSTAQRRRVKRRADRRVAVELCRAFDSPAPAWLDLRPARPYRSTPASSIL